MLKLAKYYLLLLLFISNCVHSQVNIPWSSLLNLYFGKGSQSQGQPLSIGHSDFQYTNNPCPFAGQYTVVKNEPCADALSYDAGHFFFNGLPFMRDTGYMMLVNFSADPKPQIVFVDTVSNLCNNMRYLFWAGMKNAESNGCVNPDLTFSVERLDGTVINSFQTGKLDGANDNATWFPGFYYPAPTPPKPPNFPYYGGFFNLPSGVNQVVLKIIENPSAANPDCGGIIAIDNILLSAVGPEATIATADASGGWITSTCFEGSKPVVLNGRIENGYKDFTSSDYITDTYQNPAVQWQQSLDSGYSWQDINGANALTFSHVFTKPDTFFIRMRTSEKANIDNEGCSVFSNLIQVQVDSLPAGVEFSSNSPVCTDADLIFTLSGGSNYITTGPNGYYDNSAYPHIYHPLPSDSGWYYTQISTLGGCFVTDSLFAKIVGPTANITPLSTSICYGKNVQLNASGGTKYTWTPAYEISDATVFDPFVSPKITTKYQVKVTDATGCSAYKTATVSLRDSALKALFNSPEFACPNDVFLFKDSSIGAVNLWNWNFGNGNNSDAQNPLPQSFSTNSQEDFFVRLIVRDSANCFDTSNHLIKAESNCYIAVPSAFTPNGDGLNDYLYPLNAYKATALSFSVYNRNGQLIFQTKDWTKKWDGKLNGQQQPMGTYIWLLNYTDENGKKISLKGTAVLIR